MALKKTAKKTRAKKAASPARKKAARNAATRKTATRKTAKTTTKRKYGPKAGEMVEAAVREMNAGELKSGGSGKKVTNRKQAIAIGLSEARRSGGKVPPRKRAS